MTNETIDKDLEERLAELDPPYQTNEERQIGRALDRYGIPFFYRQAMMIYHAGKHQVWYPSFTLPGYDGVVIDVAVQEPGTLPTLDAEARRQAYQANHIPAIVMGSADLNPRDWPPRLYHRIEEAYEQAHEAYRNPFTGYRG